MAHKINCTGCSAAVDHGRGGRVCANGFFQGNYPNHDRPACMRDELPARFINDDGSPRFYRPPAAGGDN